MITPSEILDRSFKSGIGYDKKDVELFLNEIATEYSSLLTEIDQLNKRIQGLNESLSYYKSIEKTLQKALVLAEKTAQDTKASALKEAELIEEQARTKAQQILSESRKQAEFMEHRTLNLLQQYDYFKIQFENMMHSQLDLLHSRSFSVDTDDFLYRGYADTASTADTVVSSLPEAEVPSKKFDGTDPSINDEFEEIGQIKLNFHEDVKEKSYKTEDGFEFFTMIEK